MVFPFIYRAYASSRYEDTQAWQDSWATPEVIGAVPNRDAADASWVLALDVEKAVLKSEDLYVALLDNSKYFDYFKRHIRPLLLHMGAPRRIIRAIAAFYEQGVRVIKVAQHYGRPFYAANGIGQGDPLSMRFINGVGQMWSMP